MLLLSSFPNKKICDFLVVPLSTKKENQNQTHHSNNNNNNKTAEKDFFFVFLH